jgi:formate hydrogenlyase transcriptional activator
MAEYTVTDLHESMGRVRVTRRPGWLSLSSTLPPCRLATARMLLVWYFLGKLRGRLGRQVETVSPSVMEKLKAYAWPGNVRELQNVLERAVILSPGSTLELGNIPLTEDAGERLPMAVRQTGVKTLQDVERNHILQVLEDCGWKVRGKAGAADRLGLKRTTLNSRMKKLGIRRPPAP